MRLAAQEKAGYYPTPDRIVDMIRERIDFPGPSEEVPADGNGTGNGNGNGKPRLRAAVLDPCAGEGKALDRLTEGTLTARYAIELDGHRAEECRERFGEARVLHSPIESVRIAHRAFSLVWLNPPYDLESGGYSEETGVRETGKRKELTFLERSIPWIADGGLLVYIIPERYLDGRVKQVLTYHFGDIEAFRFPEPEYSQFKQVVVIGKKKNRPMQTDGFTLAEAAEHEKRVIRSLVPSSPIVKLFMSTHLDAADVDRFVSDSPLWDQFAELRGCGNIGNVDTKDKRPPLPLHSGHLGMMLASGELDGIMGTGPDRHVVKGTVRKVQKAQGEPIVEIDPDTGAQKTVMKYRDAYRITVKILLLDGTIRELA